MYYINFVSRSRGDVWSLYICCCPKSTDASIFKYLDKLPFPDEEAKPEAVIDSTIEKDVGIIELQR